jgi:hypothetical protein
MVRRLNVKEPLWKETYRRKNNIKMDTGEIR